jgi:hypothetical protein
MPDRSIDDEVRENQQRQAENEAREEDDGAVVDSLEKVVNPFVDNLRENDAAPDEEDLERRRELNDAEQRPG